MLVLGAGLVASPLVRYLADQGHRVTVASRTLAKGEAIIRDVPGARAQAIDVDDRAALGELITAHDLVISLVPHTHHMPVANLCLEHRRPLVTTSYIKPEMAALSEPVLSAGLLFLNEIGLDPGIDHMSAMQIIDRVRSEGGRVVRFASNCGGLPAPEARTTPLGYKFSWSPRAVVLAARNTARYLEGGRVVDIPSHELFTHCWPLTIEGSGQYEVYTNRDCLGYIEKYGLDGVEDMFRGTIRIPGWCALWTRIGALGYLDIASQDDLDGRTYGELTASLIGHAGALTATELASFLRLDADDPVVAKMQWLGMLSDEPIGAGTTTCLDALVSLLTGKLSYAPGERDMVILQHRIFVRYADGDKEIVSTMIDYGVPDRETAMARTVGLPAAIAADLIVRGKIRITGVHGPVHREVYEPVMAKLGELGMRFEEKTRQV